MYETIIVTSLTTGNKKLQHTELEQYHRSDDKGNVDKSYHVEVNDNPGAA